MLFITTVSFILSLLVASLLAVQEVSLGKFLYKYSWFSAERAVSIIPITIFISTWLMYSQSLGYALINILIWFVIFVGIKFFLFSEFVTARGLVASLIGSTLFYLMFRFSLIWFLQEGVISIVVSLAYFMGESITLIVLLYLTLDGLIAFDIKRKQNKGLKKTLPNISFIPHVTIHVPISNEPPKVVEQTLLSLSTLDYPSYDVIVVDNNTSDTLLWMPIQDICAELGFTFHHVEQLSGFKAGALNLALSLTPPDAEIIVIVDADYIVDSPFLKETVHLFLDSNIAFVQTSQGYRNESASKITRQFSQVYQYFFDATMVARNQRNSIIFAGTMGLIRRSALEDVSGWAEWSITEDAELSLRFLAKGYRGIYINKKYGLGFMPENFIDCRRQWHRWVFGGVQLAIYHLRKTSLLRDTKNSLTFIQRVDYLLGGAISIGASIMILTSIGLIGTIILIILSSLGYIGWSSFPATIKSLSQALTIYHGFLLFHAFSVCFICRAVTGCTWRKSLVTLFSFHSLAGVLARAAATALLKHSGTFVRTPKEAKKYSLLVTLHAVGLELVLLVALTVSMVVMVLVVPYEQMSLGLIILGGWQVMIYSSTAIRAVQSSVDVHSETSTMRISSK